MKMTKIEDQDGRLLISSYALKATLTELGCWLAALVIAYQLDPKWPRYHLVLAIAAIMLVRMLSAHYDDWRKLRATRTS
jgi:hypothetical protein